MAFWSETLSVVYEVIMNLLLVLGLILLVIALATLFYPRFNKKKMNDSQTKTEVERKSRRKRDAKKLETEKTQLEKVEEIRDIGKEERTKLTEPQEDSEQENKGTNQIKS